MFEMKRCTVTPFYIYAFRWLKLAFAMIPFLIIDLIYFLANIITQPRNKNIKGQLVTGSGNGLGRQIAIEFAKNGCNVAIADIQFEAAIETAKMLHEKYNVKSKGFKVDISNFNEVQMLKKKIENDLGTVDILINNAGILAVESTLESTYDETEQVIGVNLASHIWTVQTFLNGMKERKRGHIVAISSIAGLIALPIANSYTATKFGVRGFMESLYYDICLANYQDHIQITTIFPYFIATSDKIVQYIEENQILRFFPALTPTYVAMQIIEAILKNKYEVIIPCWYSWIVKIQRILPKRTLNYYAHKVFAVQT